MMYKPPKRRKITQAERKAIYREYGGRCAYCGTKIEIGQMQVDHPIPMELYDAYAATGVDIDSMINYMPACRSCNNYKSSLTLDKFRRAVERWPEVLRRDSVTYRNAVRFGMVDPKPHKVIFYFEKIACGLEQKSSTRPATVEEATSLLCAKCYETDSLHKTDAAGV